jgi:chorismate dehydratase
MGQVSAIHADTDSHTSVVLAQVILARTYGARPRVVDFDARERVARAGSGVAGESAEWPQTLLLIGDKVVSDSPPAVRYPHQLDLGEAWKALTGLPFVYAMWMCRADRAGDPVIASAAALLDRQRRHNAMRIDWIVSQRAPEHRWPIDLAAQYLGRLLRYEVGDAERQAVERFFDEASSLGLVPRPGLTWAMEPTGAERRVAL